jgi:hypothetical protein
VDLKAEALFQQRLEHGPDKVEQGRTAFGLRLDVVTGGSVEKLEVLHLIGNFDQRSDRLVFNP